MTPKFCNSPPSLEQTLWCCCGYRATLHRRPDPCTHQCGHPSPIVQHFLPHFQSTPTARRIRSPHARTVLEPSHPFRCRTRHSTSVQDHQTCKTYASANAKQLPAASRVVAARSKYSPVFCTDSTQQFPVAARIAARGTTRTRHGSAAAVGTDARQRTEQAAHRLGDLAPGLPSRNNGNNAATATIATTSLLDAPAGPAGWPAIADEHRVPASRTAFRTDLSTSRRSRCTTSARHGAHDRAQDRRCGPVKCVQLVPVVLLLQ
ncbi:hypothetical protein AMAG_20069 [Allomyces macrogynus ATCC 38327]|uniref:Uncharacterized protein n=1 Tax=Allomyces macrogynus (strain ATCC 38327) TaxID=578462 RepID=A0A0L0T6Q3_ALLM3|nr:hypothetical protein AMAG_20069 [Allomyces macrogynus ATCC 38327]|eukprot:KNE70249.1 hypothetical protein AMAG_20069 [Allomyces macrogynus ATCC 38327]